LNKWKIKSSFWEWAFLGGNKNSSEKNFLRYKFLPMRKEILSLVIQRFILFPGKSRIPVQA